MTAIGGGALTQQLYGKLFDRLDVDSTQGLSLDELRAGDPKRPDDAFSKIFSGLDTDQDGNISRAEMSAAPALSMGAGALLATSTAEDTSETVVGDLFQRADADGDGKLSDEEMGAEAALRRAANLDSGYQSGPVFIARDADGDGLRAPGEMTALRALSLPAGALQRRFFDELSPEEQAQWSVASRRSDASGPARGAPPIQPPKVYTDAEKQKIRDQMAADGAERRSGPTGTIKYLDREIGGLRDTATADFASAPMTQTLSSRLLAQILGGLATA
jgi:Ca2+-binding EF-hand superfamily protein